MATGDFDFDLDELDSLLDSASKAAAKTKKKTLKTSPRIIRGKKEKAAKVSPFIIKESDVAIATVKVIRITTCACGHTHRSLTNRLLRYPSPDGGTIDKRAAPNSPLCTFPATTHNLFVSEQVEECQICTDFE